jgi:hypothetical protein
MHVHVFPAGREGRREEGMGGGNEGGKKREGWRRLEGGREGSEGRERRTERERMTWDVDRTKAMYRRVRDSIVYLVEDVPALECLCVYTRAHHIQFVGLYN